MMRGCVLRLPIAAALVVSASPYAAIGSSEYEATSRIGMHMHSSHTHYNNAVVIFDLNSHGPHFGSFTVGGEGHPHGEGLDGVEAVAPFPHLTIIADHFESVSILGNTLVFRAMGRKNNDPVMIQAVIKDGGPNGEGDSVWIEVSSMDDMDTMTFWNGAISSGDIKINRKGNE